MRSALVIAGIFEFLGSFLMGSNVTKTIQKGISDTSVFENEPAMYMFGMCCVIIGVAAWIIIATMYSLPVSTTHSCIGGVVGMAIVARGFGAVQWKEIIKIVASWFVSPVLSGIFTSLVFYIVRKWVLRAENSFQNAFKFYPIIIGFTLFVLTYFMMNKGIPGLKLDIPEIFKILIAIVIGVVLAVILTFTAVPYLKKKIEKEMAAEAESKDSTISIPIETKETVVVAAAAAESGKEIEMAEVKSAEAATEAATEAKEKIETPVAETVVVKKDEEVKPATPTTPREENTMFHQNIHAELTDETSKVYQIHQRAEKFDPHTERIFSYLQVLTATLNSFAHGANDVANSIGPLAAVIAVYEHGSIPEDMSCPTWVLVLGGAGIVVGLACLGYKVMAAIGVNMVKVTPSRGFAIEIGSAFVIVTGSQLGLPLSTTHCQVGSTVGVGLMEGKNSVNWSLVYQVFAGWVITLVVCAITTAAIFAFGYYAPSKIVEVVASVAPSLAPTPAI